MIALRVGFLFRSSRQKSRGRVGAGSHLVGPTRSSNNRLLDEPRANLKTYGESAFFVAAPRLWNPLSLQIRLSSSEAVFKANLKTYLFKRAFDLD